ncbi:MAG: ABC transporter ATP-binding protein, partial [Clostridia bacterium]|nr:ABC transporter ATP-binding protein [Clostridia bacterium]
MIKMLWGLTAPQNKRMALLTPLLIIGEVLMEVSIPLLMAGVINQGVQAGDLAAVLRYGGGMAGMALLSLAFGVAAAKTSVTASVGFSENVRQALFYRVQDFSFANVDRFSTASLITRLTTDVGNLQMAFMMCIRMLVRSPVMLVSATLMALRLNAKLATIFLVAIPVLGGSLITIAAVTFPRFQRMLTRVDGLNARVQENLNAMRVVKAYVREEYETERFEQAADDLRRAMLSAEKLLVLNGPIMTFCMNACMIAVSWFGGQMIITGTMELGDLMSFLSYISQILMSLMMLSMIFVMLLMSRASAARISEVLREVPEIRVERAEPVTEVADGSIAFDGVTFSYGGADGVRVLKGIDLAIASGETIGIIGGTGSAKSTLVQLIPRLYDATEGRVLVGGIDVKDYDLTALRKQVAMVLQKNELFSGTIRENLLWGDEAATQEQIEAACRAASAHDFITSFPDGYET